MQINIFEKGDLVEIPAGVHYFKADCDSRLPINLLSPTKQPVVGIYLYAVESTATVYFFDSIWNVPLKSVRFPKEKYAS